MWMCYLQIVIYFIYSFIYLFINKLVPVGLKSLFEPISQVHAYTLRGSSNNIFIRTPETDATRNSFVIVVQCYGTDLANEI